MGDMPPQPPYLGEFEYAVLLAVMHLGQEAYAVPIRELIEERTGRPVARGARGKQSRPLFRFGNRWRRLYK